MTLLRRDGEGGLIEVATVRCGRELQVVEEF